MARSKYQLYLTKEYVFGGKCPFWATCSVISRKQIGSAVDEDRIVSEWWEYVHTDYGYAAVCDVYLGTCLSSCTFGIIWFILFMLCGKGGHNISLQVNRSLAPVIIAIRGEGVTFACRYERPWRIILPAVIFNFLFTGVSIYAHHNFGQGYKAFNKSIMGIPAEIYNVYNVVLTLRYKGLNTGKQRLLSRYSFFSDCDVINGYMHTNNFYTHHDLCNILPYLQVILKVFYHL